MIITKHFKYCLFKTLVLLSITSCDIKVKNTIIENNNIQDSIDYWVEISKKENLSYDAKIKALNKAYNKNELEKNDSIKIRKLSKIAYQMFVNNDSLLFKKFNEEALKISDKLNDSIGLANVYWNYADYYLKYEILDSAYFYYSKAAKVFSLLDKEFPLGRVLYNMSIIQKDIKDYTGSEITAFDAISNFDEEKHQFNLYLCYNLLGVVYYNLEEYNKSIESHNRALDYLKMIKNKGTLIEGSLNNIGLIYHRRGELDKAIKTFNEALSFKQLDVIDINLYTKLIDNLAYSKFLAGDTLGVEKEFYKSLAIRDSLNNISGILLNKLHLSEFYTFKQDTTMAITFANEASILAKTVNNHRDHLAALQLLAKFDHDNSSNYLSEYVNLNDSLQKEERTVRNKFTRIQYETDEYMSEAERLLLEKTLVTIIGITILLLTISLFFIRLQRAKNKRLILEQEQQKDREEIYRLMLEQQSKLEEGRLEERTRIAEELHDGILGSMYGTRMGLGFLKIHGDETVKDKFKEYLDEIHQIEKEVRAVSHALKSETLSSCNDFVALIKVYLDRLNKTNDLEIIVTNDSNITWENVTDEIKINVFRIVQELYFNTIKHAQAKNLYITFSLENEIFNLVVEDDGKGFDVNKFKKGIGLKNIKNRIEKINGTLKIQSDGTGTKFSIFV